MLGASLGSAAIGAFSSNKAAKAQEAAAQAQTALEGRVYDETTERFQPFLNSGQNALAAYNFEMGLGERPTFGGQPLQVSQFSETIPGTPATQPGRYINNGETYFDGSTPSTSRTGYRVGDQVFYDQQAANDFAAANATGGQQYGGFQQSPGYQFQLQQGLGAIDSSAASRGNLFSGATMKAAQAYGQGLANQDYGNYLNRLGGMAASGQNAAGNLATAGANYATGAGNALASAGNAQAAGYIGVGNSIQNGIGNVLGVMNYQQMQSPAQNPWSQSQFNQVQRVL